MTGARFAIETLLNLSPAAVRRMGRGEKLLLLAGLKSSNRDEPPLGEGAARMIMVKVVDGKIYVVSILDTDTRKGVKRGIPGGRQKGGPGQVETPRQTAVIESIEEAGAVPCLDRCMPVCSITSANEHRRDSSDVDTQTRGVVSTCLFAHFGDLKLEEMADSDAKDPRWAPLENILSGVECNGDRPWFLSHIIYLVRGLILIGEGFERYVWGQLTEEHEIAFFRDVAEVTRRDADRANYEAMLALKNLNILDVVAGIVGDRTRAEKLIARYRCESFIGGGYFMN